MFNATLDHAALATHVVKVKAAWRDVERQKTWEQKIAAIERMRHRDKALQVTRDNARAFQTAASPRVSEQIKQINQALGLG